MNKINFINNKKDISADFDRFNSNVVVVNFYEDITSFSEYFSNGFYVDSEDYTEYNTVYKIQGNDVFFSNNKSVFVDFPKPQPSKLSILRGQLYDIEAEFKLLDYIGNKISTGRGTIEEYKVEIARMDELAKLKNEVQSQINVLEKE